jgi:hypothetical protein
MDMMLSKYKIILEFKLYASDKKKIVTRVSEIAEEDWKEHYKL